MKILLDRIAEVEYTKLAMTDSGKIKEWSYMQLRTRIFLARRERTKTTAKDILISIGMVLVAIISMAVEI